MMVVLEQLLIINYGTCYEERIEFEDCKILDKLLSQSFIGQNVDENTWECMLTPIECRSLFIWLSDSIGFGNFHEADYDSLRELFDVFVSVICDCSYDTIEIAYQSRRVQVDDDG